VIYILILMLIRNNQIKDARGSGVRIKNKNSQLDYIIGNAINAKVRSLLLYDNVNNI